MRPSFIIIEACQLQMHTCDITKIYALYICLKIQRSKESKILILGFQSLHCSNLPLLSKQFHCSLSIIRQQAAARSEEHSRDLLSVHQTRYSVLSVCVACCYSDKGAGGLHQDFLEIDFLVVSDREE